MRFFKHINLDRDITAGAAYTGSFQLESPVPERFVDIRLTKSDLSSFSKTLSPAQAREIRDALTDYLNAANNVIVTPAPTKKAVSRDKLAPQAQTVLDHLANHGSLSAVEAAAIYKVRSLSRRINDIEETGINIHRENKVDATGQRYTSYALAA